MKHPIYQVELSAIIPSDKFGQCGRLVLSCQYYQSKENAIRQAVITAEQHGLTMTRQRQNIELYRWTSGRTDVTLTVHSINVLD